VAKRSFPVALTAHSNRSTLHSAGKQEIDQTIFNRKSI